MTTTIPTPRPRPTIRRFDDAFRDLVDTAFLKTTKYQEQQWRADQIGAHPDIIEFNVGIVRVARKEGIPLFVHEVWRDSSRQTQLYVQGVSKALAGQSPHNYGMATDVIHSVHGWDIDKKSWEIIGHMGKELILSKGLAIHSLAWGGDWKFYDPAHWQVINWKELKNEYPKR